MSTGVLKKYDMMAGRMRTGWENANEDEELRLGGLVACWRPRPVITVSDILARNWVVGRGEC